MTRLFGQVSCSIWDDADFCALSAGAQRTYLFLFTQREITACGSLPLTLRRWSKKAREDDLDIWLAELTDANFVLLDEDTEELLVRTFAKHDEGYKHAVRRKAVISTAKAIRSSTLLTVLVDELARLGVSLATPYPVESRSSGTLEPVEPRGFLVNVSRERGETGTGNLETGDRAASVALPWNPEVCEEHQPNGTDEPCGKCRRARETVQREKFATLEADATRRKIAAKAIADCALCDEKGMRLHPESKLPAGRCDHRVLASAAAS